MFTRQTEMILGEVDLIIDSKLAIELAPIKADLAWIKNELAD